MSSSFRLALLTFTDAVPIALKSSRVDILNDWVQLPLVITSMLVLVWAVNSALVLLPFAFPASVACMLLLLVVLLLSSWTLGRKKTAIPLRYLEPTADFLLRWISIFFCPSFVLLPVEEGHSGLSGLEIGKIVALFLISFPVFIVLSWAVVMVCSAISPFRYFNKDRDRTDDEASDAVQSEDSSAIELNSFTGARDQTPVPSEDASMVAAESATTVTLPEPARAHQKDLEPGPQFSAVSSFPGSLAPLQVSRAESVSTLTPPGGPISPSSSARAERAAALAARLPPHFPTFIYILIFLVSLPPFFLSHSSSPSDASALAPFLAWTVLAFLIAVRAVPPRVRRIAHPILVCSALTLLGVWALGRARGWTLTQTLDRYATGSKYLVLWDVRRAQGAAVRPPGAGDVLTSVLDAAIVSLAVPMYRYRLELKRHAFELFFTIVPLALLSLFIYPLVARAITLAPSRALAFAARSVTTPLALPMEASLKGDAGLTVVLCILTGVLGAIAGPQMLRVLRVKDTDFMTIGVVLGCTASAISTAALLSTNPRAAAISSLAFVLYGICCVVLVSVPAVVGVVQKVAGL